MFCRVTESLLLLLLSNGHGVRTRSFASLRHFRSPDQTPDEAAIGAKGAGPTRLVGFLFNGEGGSERIEAPLD